MYFSNLFRYLKTFVTIIRDMVKCNSTSLENLIYLLCLQWKKDKLISSLPGILLKTKREAVSLKVENLLMKLESSWKQLAINLFISQCES